jgi:hypothetical protein
MCKEILEQFLNQEHLTIEKLPEMFPTIKDFEFRCSDYTLFLCSRTHGILAKISYNVTAANMKIFREPHIIFNDEREAQLLCFEFEG